MMFEWANILCLVQSLTMPRGTSISFAMPSRSNIHREDIRSCTMRSLGCAPRWDAGLRIRLSSSSSETPLRIIIARSVSWVMILRTTWLRRRLKVALKITPLMVYSLRLLLALFKWCTESKECLCLLWSPIYCNKQTPNELSIFV